MAEGRRGGLISVDRWGEASQVYFLTHLHADHTRGLSSGWARGPIFCSAISARLFPARFPGFDLSLLRVLDLGVPHAFTLASPTTGSEVAVRVTAVDACHCPGAVMYLFQGDLGCVLHTGDFRWESNDERAWLGKRALLNALGGDGVDVLYLDNTFCNPSFDFPPREIAAKQVVHIINSHPDHDIVIGIDTLGKEELLVEVSNALKTKVWVWPERLQTMHLLGFDHAFTTQTQVTRVRAIPRYSLTSDTLMALNRMQPTIGIMPSGLPWALKMSENDSSLDSSVVTNYKSGEGIDDGSEGDGKQMKAPEKCLQYIYPVPYSAHSCYSEIRDLMKLVRPSKVSGIVSSRFCDINPRHFFGHMCKAKQLSDGLSMNLGGAGSPNVDDIQTVSAVGRHGEERRDKVRRIRNACLGVRRSRVSLLRRGNRGAKIAEADHG